MMRDSTADLLLFLTDFVLSEHTFSDKVNAEMRVMLKVKSEACRKGAGGQRQKPKVTDADGRTSDGS